MVYKAIMQRDGSNPIQFIVETKNYFTKGYQLERLLPTVESLPEAKFDMCQQIYDNYYHGTHYYIFSLLSGEVLEPVNHYFMHFCNAKWFMAKLDWSGILLDQPLAKKLPTRDVMLYYAMRDPTVVKQYATNPEYAKSLMTLLRAFQSDMRTAHVVAKVRHEVRAKAAAAAAATPQETTAPKKTFRAARMKKAPK